MAESLGDKPSSRVLRPPGGGSSNIFGGSDETSSGNRMNTKPTFQSSVFAAEPESARPQSTNRPGNQCSDIFGTGSGNNDKPRVSDAKKVSKTHQSSIFQEPEPMSEEKRRVAAPRLNTILGPSPEAKGNKPPVQHVVGTSAEITSNKPLVQQPSLAVTPETRGTKPKPVTPGPVKDNNPHIGPVKNDSGVRCSQPPGGKSSISFF